jgi:hypothetical protein
MSKSQILRRPTRVSDLDYLDDDMYNEHQVNRAERSRIRREREIKRQMV